MGPKNRRRLKVQQPLVCLSQEALARIYVYDRMPQKGFSQVKFAMTYIFCLRVLFGYNLRGN